MAPSSAHLMALIQTADRWGRTLLSTLDAEHVDDEWSCPNRRDGRGVPADAERNEIGIGLVIPWSLPLHEPTKTCSAGLLSMTDGCQFDSSSGTA